MIAQIHKRRLTESKTTRYSLNKKFSEIRVRVVVRRTVGPNHCNSIWRSSMLKALRVVSGGLLVASLGCGTEGSVDEPITQRQSALAAAANDYGVAETFHTSGAIDF